MPDRKALAALLLLLGLAACNRSAEAAVVEVYKTPTCGCCSAWVEHMRKAGFTVRVTDMEDVTPVARKLGVPDDLRSCHSATAGGYFLEGHVPATDVKKLLEDKPRATGVSVLGMPIGSPGMEQDGMTDAYASLLVDRQRKSRMFVHHPAKN